MLHLSQGTGNRNINWNLKQLTLRVIEVQWRSSYVTKGADQVPIDGGVTGKKGHFALSYPLSHAYVEGRSKGGNTGPAGGLFFRP